MKKILCFFAAFLTMMIIISLAEKKERHTISPSPISITKPQPPKITPPTPIPPKPKTHPLIEAHNQIRKSHHLQPLQQDPELMAFAQKWADHMAKTHIMRHQSLKGKAMGENIAMGQKDIQEVMNCWMRSPGHKANILRNSFTTIGVGVAEGKNGMLFWCVDFGRN